MTETPDLRSSRRARHRRTRSRHDRSAQLDALYRALAPQVAGYLRAQGAADPEDLAGEVFLAVARGLDDFAGDEDRLRAWVFTIAHHKMIDDRRRRIRRATDPTAPDDLPPVSDRRDPTAPSDTRVDAAPAVRALDRLTADQRAVILLRVVADLSVADVAQILRKEPGAVKALQRRALATLARLVPQLGP